MANLAISFFMTSFVMSAIILLVMLINKTLLKSLGAKFKCIMWTILLIGLLIPFRPMIGEAPLQIEVPQQIHSVVTPNPEKNESQKSDSTTKPTETITETVSPKSSPLISPIMIIVAIWGITALGILIFHISKYIKFVMMIKRWGVTVEDEKTLAILNSIKESEGLTERYIDLKVCNFINTSMLSVFFKTAILLPDKQLDKDELELIFRHELIHYKRHDLFLKLLIVIATSIHWFNPLVYLMCSVMQIDGESACDEVVLENADIENRQFYGEVIIGMIGKKNKFNTTLSTCFYAGKSNIKRRLDFIMNTGNKNNKLAIIGILIVLIMTVMSGSVIALTSGSGGQGNTNLPPVTSTSSETKPELTQKEAEKIALNKTGGGKVVKFSTDRDDGVKTYDIKIIRGNKEYEISIDTIDGTIRDYQEELIPTSNPSSKAVITSKPPAPPKSTPPASSGISESRAREIALNKVGGGRIVEFSIDIDDRIKMYDVKIIHGHKEYEMSVDASTGTIIDYEVYTIDYDDD